MGFILFIVFIALLFRPRHYCGRGLFGPMSYRRPPHHHFDHHHMGGPHDMGGGHGHGGMHGPRF